MVNDKWKKFMQKSELVDIGDGEIVTVFGLSFKEVGEMTKYHESKDYAGAMAFLLETTLRKAPEVDDVDVQGLIDGLSSEVGMKLVQKVQELSGLGGDEKKEVGAN